MRFFLLIHLVLLSNLSYGADISNVEPLEVTTFNVGYARASLFNLVPCIRLRVNLLTKVIDEKLQSEKGTKAFLFQEFYNRRAFRLIVSVAQKHNYDYYPKTFKELKENGILVLTNLDVLKHEWLPFKATKYPGINRGVRLIYAKTLEGKGVIIGNTHTSYSGRQKADTVHLSHLNQVASIIQEKSNEQYELILGGDLNIGSKYTLKRQKYNPIEEIWEPFYEKVVSTDMKFLKYETPSWDEEKNNLVSRPSFFARLFATYNGKWDENTSDIDHLIVSSSLETENTSVVFDQMYESRGLCRDANNIFLSDHFAVKTNVLFQ
jgi:endonuclease/exonuclease/phosphatase family metal-dependent hydrolase